MKLNLDKVLARKKYQQVCFVFNSLLSRGDFCCLLITFANSLDPDQARQNVGLVWIQTVWHPNGIEKSSIHIVKYGTII